ncbi:MAG: hypothetical protein AVDCRST_MAG77-208 [uncultured Chloroflexi bacterium]|uniref:Uncharacterized protein n=1 Tax=uncultured Chloroflexota bacterium TaxID=166587 RepID=A0A6J4HAN1_9CHLR|nr:MAG: hypothetical protein AVDCRST_MAG77-208 [uncultured Chloroflexota bacterium]
MRTLDALDAHARSLALSGTSWIDPYWDEAAGLLWMITKEPHPTNVPPGTPVHVVRDTLWYAIGLLLRNGPGDHPRALCAIDSSLRTQLDAPGTPHHGTFKRSPEEPEPPAESVVWKHFDPNWREFVGTLFAIILEDFPDALPAELLAGMEHSLRLAAEGTLQRNVTPAYTNIALMSAFLLRYCGDRFGNPAWIEAAEKLAEGVYALYQVDQTFPEYNSPTYYGVNLFALALWRSYSASPVLRRTGEEMEAGCWRDVARFYHAGLRNLCGPFDRSYGMDMTRYAAIVGMWIWASVGEERAPFPDWRREFGHTNDFCMAPTVAHVGARVPDDVLPHLLAFRGERQVERVIATDPRRVATAWLSERLIAGAEDAGGSKKPSYQYHPATAHWRCPDGSVGWLRLTHSVPVDARADAGRLEIWSSSAGDEGEYAFQIFVPSVSAAQLSHDYWSLPGLIVRIAADAEGPELAENDGILEVRYRHPAGRRARFVLRLEASA